MRVKFSLLPERWKRKPAPPPEPPNPPARQGPSATQLAMLRQIQLDAEAARLRMLDTQNRLRRQAAAEQQRARALASSAEAQARRRARILAVTPRVVDSNGDGLDDSRYPDALVHPWRGS